MHELGFIHAPAFRALKGTMTKGKRALNNGTNIKDCKNQFDAFSPTTPYRRNTPEWVCVFYTWLHPSSFTGATFFQRLVVACNCIHLQWCPCYCKWISENQSCTQWGSHEILAAPIGRKKKRFYRIRQLNFENIGTIWRRMESAELFAGREKR